MVNLDFLFQNGTSLYINVGDKVYHKNKAPAKNAGALFDGSTQRDRLMKRRSQVLYLFLDIP